MSTAGTPSRLTESPDPASHAANIYDTTGTESEWIDEADDDDMNAGLATEDSEDMEFFDPAEEDEGEYHDAEDNLNGIEIEFSMDEAGDGLEGEEDGNETEGGDQRPNPTQASRSNATNPTPVPQIHVSQNHIMQLLGRAGLRRILQTHGVSNITIGLSDDDDADNNNGGFGFLGTRRSARRKRDNKDQLPKVPSEEGRKLMDSGTFGSNEYYKDMLRRRKAKLGRRLLSRELGIHKDYSCRANRLIAQGLIPSSNADTIIHYNSRCYSGQFSDDGNFFFSCAQDFRVRMYDTSNPYKWEYYKTVLYHGGQWTITDATLSPDNKYLAYSSIRSIVSLAQTDPDESGDPWLLDFSDMAGGGRRGLGFSPFGIWSIRFSGDGREIVAGTSNHSVLVYDIETRKTILNIRGHTEDVNAVCFGDKNSPHILYSGSDDTLIKVWDRRSMGDSREAGVFMGHTEGLTYVDSKGDGRYVLSNGKEQQMKLWDLRKMMSTAKAEQAIPAAQGYTTHFDYRFVDYQESEYQKHPNDCSIVSFRGHRVLKTLIRCHFSPPNSTDSRYVYTGSEDGSVYIYNLDATLAGKIDVEKATMNSRPRDPSLYMQTHGMGNQRSRGEWKTCVRDASWHPNAPIIAATCWNGYGGMATGTCTTHSWNDTAEEDEGLPVMGERLDDRLRYDEDLYDDPGRGHRSRLRSQRVAGRRNGDDDEDW